MQKVNNKDVDCLYSDVFNVNFWQLPSFNEIKCQVGSKTGIFRLSQ